ncbi:hypothetical protein ALMP_08860 [Streptomyces sp. A012304]|nr:hypothetical protein ALMP_08860 [Streptomyces sp. A012304]
MLAAQSGGDGEFVGGGGAPHGVEEGTALGGEEGSEVVHRLIVGQSVDGTPPVAVSDRGARTPTARIRRHGTSRISRTN